MSKTNTTESSVKARTGTVKQGSPKPKKFAFVNDAADREFKNLPVGIQHQFGLSLRAVQNNKKPFLPIKNVSESVGPGSTELIINGSPANRCIYVAKFDDSVVVLHSFEKTTNQVDRQAMKTAKARYKQLKKLMTSK